MYYPSHETVNSNNGIVIDVAATVGDAPDSKPYIERIDYIEKNLDLKIQEACTDNGYNTNLINQQLSEKGINLYTPERTEQKRGTTEFQRKDLQYDEEKDVFICPGKKGLPLYRLNRTADTVTKEYRCSRTICKGCPLHSGCIGRRETSRRIQINTFEGVVKENHEKGGTERHAKVLLLWQVWGKGSFVI